MNMAKIKDVYVKAWEKTKELKTLTIFLIVTNIVFLFFGQWMIANGIPGVVELKKEFLKQLPEMGYLKPLSGPLAPYLSLKIAYTFLFNLIFGALLSTTAPGIIFLLPIYHYGFQGMGYRRNLLWNNVYTYTLCDFLWHIHSGIWRLCLLIGRRHKYRPFTTKSNMEGQRNKA